MGMLRNILSERGPYAKKRLGKKLNRLYADALKLARGRFNASCYFNIYLMLSNDAFRAWLISLYYTLI